MTKLRPSKTAPKRFCVRGHDLSATGFNWNRNASHEGVVYLTRRCSRCAVEDVRRCRARKKARTRKKAA